MFSQKKLSKRLTQEWNGTYPSGVEHAGTVYARQIEAIVHELSHAAVLFGPKKPWKKVEDGIASAFDHYVRPYASDVSELKAIAIELIVLRQLEVAVDFDSIIYTANLRSSWSNEGRIDFIGQQLCHPLAIRRAGYVMKWITDVMAS